MFKVAVSVMVAIIINLIIIQLITETARLVSEHARLVSEHARLVSETARLASENARLASENADPFINRQKANLAFQEAEAWRKHVVEELYANMTDADFDQATRWKSYAQPFSMQRSCHQIQPSHGHGMLLQISSAHDDLHRLTASKPWSSESRRTFLSIYAFHTTGIEGNTLTLPETALVIDEKPLLAGFSKDVNPLTPLTSDHVLEVRNMRLLLEALGFASAPLSFPFNITAGITFKHLTDMNSAITRDLRVSVGLRHHAVGIGHQKVLLPMPDELPILVQEFEQWLNGELHQLLAIKATQSSSAPLSTDLIHRALSTACDAHTRFVHIHPFSDGNGRLARILSALVVSTINLPPPIFSRHERVEYIQAVGAATINMQYASICEMHTRAVLESLQLQLQMTRSSDSEHADKL
jgi:hypothetical protein